MAIRHSFHLKGVGQHHTSDRFIMGIFDRLTERVGGIFGDFIEEVRISDEVHVLLQRATSQYDIGHYDEALRTLSQIQTATPLARVHHLRGMCHFQRGNPQEAARELRRAIELKEQAHSHLWAGLAMSQIHEWRAAQDHLLRAMQLSDDEAPVRADIHAALGLTYLRQNRADKAIKELRKGMRSFELPPLASVTLAEALFARGQHQEALAALSHAGVEELDDMHAQLVHARITRELGMYQIAHDAYARAAALGASQTGTAQQRSEALLGASRASLELGDLDAARGLLERAEREMSPSALGASFYVLRAMLATRTDDLPAAARFYERALSQDALHGEALLGAGALSLLAGQPEAALDHYSKVMTLHATRHGSEALLGQGRARHAMQDYSGARQVLEEAARHERDASHAHSAPTSRLAEVLIALAEVSLATNDDARALMDLYEARAHRSTFDSALRTRHESLTQRALEGLKPKLDLPDTLSDPLQIERTLIALQSFIASDGRLTEFLLPTQHILQALDAPLSIAIVGEFNAGKSTLINALIGEDILPTGVLPTTAHTGIIQYGPRQAARVVWRGEEDPVEVSFKEAKRLMKDNGEAIDHLQYLSPHPELRAVHFWDTPGFNALEERHEEVASRALEEAEAILWVLDANQVLSQTEFDRIQTIPAGQERLIVLINKVDRLGSFEDRQDDVDHLIDYVQSNAKDHIAGCFPVSALQTRRIQKELRELESSGDDDAVKTLTRALDEAGIDSFREHLQHSIIDRAGFIKTLESKRHLTALVLRMARFKRELEQRHDRLSKAMTEVGQWVEELRGSRPRRVAECELIDLEDGVDFMLRALVKEVAEALHPSSSWVSRAMTLGEEDGDYLVELIAERFTSLLNNSRDRVINDVRQLEAEIAGRTGPLLGELSLQDARGLSLRLEGFQDEVTVLKLLLEERVYGRLMARAQGQIDAAAHKALDEITRTGDDPQRWKALLRPLLPDIRESFVPELETWYATFFAAAARFCERAHNDLELLKLEARYRYELDDLEQLLARDASSQGG